MIKILLILVLALCGCSNKESQEADAENQKKNKTTTVQVESPDGSFEVKQTTADRVEQKIEPLTKEDQAQLAFFASKVDPFIAAYGKAESKTAVDLKILDEAFKNWTVSSGENRPANNAVISIVGTALGNYLRDHLDMEWVKVTDEHGSDFALRGKTAEVMCFPHSIVLKRVETHEYGFLERVFYATKQMIESGDYKKRKNSRN